LMTKITQELYTHIIQQVINNIICGKSQILVKKKKYFSQHGNFKKYYIMYTEQWNDAINVCSQRKQNYIPRTFDRPRE